jgi:hypothetical protein
MKFNKNLKQLLLLAVCLYWLPSVFAQLDTTVTPGQNFDLSEWKLNYPMDNTEEENLTNFTNNYFYTDSLTGGMVFKCPNITNETGGSSYPRCELRELLNKGASASDKTNNWTLSTNSTRDEYGGYNGVLYATLQVDRVSNTYDALSRVGRVIVGQIHGDDNEPCRIYYRLLPGHTKGSVYFAHEQSKAYGDDKQEFWHELIGSRDSDAEEPEDGIALGDIWSYKIDVQDESLTVTIYDSTKTELASKTITSELSGSDNFDANYGSADNYLYFKAGVYNQNNGGEASDYAQATFFELFNTHDSLPDGNLSVSPNSLLFQGAGGSQTVSISSDDNWTASTSENWIILSADSGDGNADMEISVEQNSEGASREGNVSITNANGTSRSVTVMQAMLISEGEAQELIISSAVASIENTEKGEIAANVLDNNFSTIWAGDGTNGDPTLDLNLATYYEVSAIEISFYKQDQRETYFSVQYWNDTQYVDVLLDQTQVIVSETQADDLFMFDFSSAVLSNKIRVIGHGNSESEWNSYKEVNLYGWNYNDDEVTIEDNGFSSSRLYPNPCEGTFVIENSLGADIQIFNASGALVFKQNIISNSEKLKTSLPQGIYLVLINSNQKAPCTEKLIIK